MNLEIFYNSTGEFQWAGIAAIFAAISALTSLIFSILSYSNSRKTLKQQLTISKNNIDANIKSKSRIEWIQEVRILVSKLVIVLLKFDKKWYWNSEEMESFILESYEKITLIQLYFGDDTEIKAGVLLNKKENDGKNNLIYAKLEELKNKIEEVQARIKEKSEEKQFDKSEKKQHNMKVFLDSENEEWIVNCAQELKNIFRLYFKIEWVKAKNGE